MTDVAPGTAGTVEARWPVDVVRGLPLALALVALVWIAADDGGFESTTWYPAALLVTAVLAVTTLALPDAPLRGAALVASLALGGFALWSYASILWADDRGAAWHGANLTLFYAVVFLLFASCRPSERTVTWVLTALTATIAAMGARHRLAREPQRGRRGCRAPLRAAVLTHRVRERDGVAVRPLGLARARARGRPLGAARRALRRPRERRRGIRALRGGAEPRLDLHDAGRARRLPRALPAPAAGGRGGRRRRARARGRAADPSRGLPRGRRRAPRGARGRRRRPRHRGGRPRRRWGRRCRCSTGLELSVARAARPAGRRRRPGDRRSRAFAVRDDPAGRVRTGWHQFTQDRNAGEQRLAFRRAREQPVRLLARRPRRVPSASDRRRRLGQLRDSLRRGPTERRAATSPAQPLGADALADRAWSEQHCWRSRSARRCGPSSGGTAARCRWRS